MEADDSASFLTLPLEDRISHKLWKARQHAYNELETMFSQASVSRATDTAISKYYKRPELFESYITDSNVVAQESAVKALLSFLKYMAEVPGITDLCGAQELVTTWVPALVEKGCTASKSGTKEASMACILLVVSFDNNICNCINSLEPMWSKKLPKLLTATLNVCASTIEQYGFVNVSQQEKMHILQSLVEVLPKLCSHADKNVRNESMKVILQLYTWFDKPVLQDLLLAKLKPIQQKDLDKLFQSYEGSIPPASTPSLFVWAVPVADEQEQDEHQLDGDNQAQNIDSDGDTMMGNNALATAIDPYEMYPVQTILDKLPNGFYSNLSSAKWKDRVEALEEFYEKTLANGKCKKLSARDEDYSELVRKYCSIITSDANLQAVQLATSSIDVLVTALRSEFNAFALDTLNALLTRSKEKKANVADVIFSTLLNLSTYYKLEMCLDSILTHMKAKVPQVKIVTCKFLFELLTNWIPTEQLYKTMVFASLREILSSLQPIVNDNQQATRNEAFKCVAALIKLFGERELATYLEKLDNLKRKKILELVDGIEVKASASANASASDGSTQQKRLKPASLVSQTRSNTVPSRSTATTGSTIAGTSSNSTIPSKRLATSPLKPRAASSMGRSATVGAAASATKSSRLTSRSLATPQLPRLEAQPRSHASNTQQQQQQQLTDPSSSSSSSSAAFQSNMSSRMSHLNDEVNKLRQERQEWLKERNELLSNLNNSKLQISKLSKQLNDAEISVSSLQRQLQDSKVELNDKDIKIRELEARLSHGNVNVGISNGNAAASPLSASSSASINRGRLTSTTLSPLRSSTKKTFNNHSTTNPTSTGTIGAAATNTTPPHRMRSPSESSDDLPRRVNSLNLNNHLMQEESWKRAAEVTNQLKARIERMRAKSRSGFKDAPAA